MPISDVQPSGFFSPVEEALHKIPRKQGNANAWLNSLQQAGAPKDQILDSGLHDFLHSKPVVTKDEALQHIRQNQPVVEEQQVFRPKWEAYSTPGGENYRETALTLPDHGPATDELRVMHRYDGFQGHSTPETLERDINYLASKRKDDPSEYYARKKIDDKEKFYHHGHLKNVANPIAHYRAKDFADENGDKTLHLDEIQSDWHQQGRDSGYRAESHADLEKKKQALIDMQKDIHSRMSQGYSAADGAAENKKPLGASDYANLLRIPKIVEALSAEQQKVPDAPFKNTWYQLALKHALMTAAKEGHDRISLPYGNDVADRFDIRKQADKFHWNPEEGTLEVFKGGQSQGTFDAKDEKDLAALVGKEVAAKIAEHHYLAGDEIPVGGQGMRKYYDEIYPNWLNKFGKQFGAQVEDRHLNSHGKGHSLISLNADGTEHPIGHYDDAGEAQARAEELNQSIQQHVAQNPASGPAARVVARPVDAKQVKVHSFPITPEMRAHLLGGQPYKDGGPVRRFAEGGSVQLEPSLFRKILAIPRKAGNGQAWRNAIMKTGVSEDDARQMGLHHIFDHKGTLGRDEVLDIASNNVPSINVQVLHDDPTKWGEDNESRATYGDQYNREYQSPGGRNYREHLLKLDRYQRGNEPYRSPHFPHQNILAHVRTQDYTLPGNKKALMLDEIQSDWHQDGKQKGYATDPVAQRALDDYKADLNARFSAALKRNLVNKIKHPMHGPYDYVDPSENADDIANKIEETYFHNHKARYLGEDDKYRSLLRAAHMEGLQNETKVPNGPFKSNWHHVALKYALQHAVDNGYDTIALPYGEDVANRMHKGDDPKGMMHWYDTVYPSVLQKMIAPYGGKVEEGAVPVAQPPAGAPSYLRARLLHITPEMREAYGDKNEYADGGKVQSSYPYLQELIDSIRSEGRQPVVPVPNRWFQQPDKFPHVQGMVQKALAHSGRTPEDFHSGAFIDPRTGEVLGTRIHHDVGVAINPQTGRPMMSVGHQADMDRLDPRHGSYTKSNLVRKALYKPTGGDPLLDAMHFIATIENSRAGHQYGLSTQYAGPTELHNTMTGDNPTLRPRSRGDIWGVGDVVGQMQIGGRGKHHDVYEKLLVAPKGSDVQGKLLTKKDGGAIPGRNRIAAMLRRQRNGSAK